MELSKAVIVNAAWGKWYPQGQKRLLNSLNYHGWAGDILTYCNEPINDYFDKDCPYTIKAAALYEAYKKGYDIIIWLDCSVWAIKEPNSFVNEIIKNGSYIYKSGFNLAQTSSDNALSLTGITRDEAELVPECASNMFGFDLRNTNSKSAFLDFLQYAKDGVYHGSRFHDNQSHDKRFLFHRQDQTALTIAWYKNKLNPMFDSNVFSAYHYDNQKANDSVYFLMRGL